MDPEMNANLLALMPKLIAVTPEEVQAAQRIADRLRASSRVSPQGLDGGAHARLTVGVSLPLGDLYYLLSWLDHMAGA